MLEASCDIAQLYILPGQTIYYGLPGCKANIDWRKLSLFWVADKWRTMGKLRYEWAVHCWK